MLNVAHKINDLSVIVNMLEIILLLATIIKIASEIYCNVQFCSINIIKEEHHRRFHLKTSPYVNIAHRLIRSVSTFYLQMSVRAMWMLNVHTLKCAEDKCRIQNKIYNDLCQFRNT